MADLVAALKQLRLYGMAASYADGVEQRQPAMTTPASALTALVYAEATEALDPLPTLTNHGLDANSHVVAVKNLSTCLTQGIKPAGGWTHVLVATSFLSRKHFHYAIGAGVYHKVTLPVLRVHLSRQTNERSAEAECNVARVVLALSREE